MPSNPFPVVYSTLAAGALQTEVLPQFGLVDVRKCYLWNRGLSDIYLVETATQPLILRVSHYHWRSQADIEFEMAWLAFLSQNELPIAYPLKTAAGEMVVTIAAPEGDRYASLFTYAPGGVPIGDLSPQQSYQVGEVLAKIHAVSADFDCPVSRQALTPDYLLDGAFADIVPFLQAQPGDVSYLRDVVTDLKARFATMPRNFPYWVVCWGDPHSGNVHFTDTQALTLFDFDQCAYGWRIFELAKFLEIALRIGTIPKVRDAMFAGYQSVSPLEEFELELLQPMTQMAHLWVWWISLTAARLHNYSRLDTTYFRSRMERLKRLRAPTWQLF